MYELFKPDVLDSNEKLFSASSKFPWQTFVLIALFLGYLFVKGIVTHDMSLLAEDQVRFAFFVVLSCVGSLAYALGWDARHMKD